MRFLVGALTRHRRVLLFLCWGAALLVLIKFGGYRTFLRPEFGGLLMAGYIILLLLIAAELFREGEAPLRGTLLLAPAVLVVPVLFILNSRGAELDGYAFQKRLVGTPRVALQIPPHGSNASPPSAAGPASAAADSAASPLSVAGSPDGSGVVSVTPLDLYRSSNQYEGRSVSLVGMTSRNDEVRKEFGPGSLLAFRFRVACCAADAQPLAVVVQGRSGQPEYPDNTWIRIEGRFRIHLSRGEKVPVIEDATMSPTAAPQPRYLY